jgi:hypothetical protein
MARIETVTQTPVGVPPERLADALKDGAHLCRVMNAVQPGAVVGAAYEPPFSAYVSLQNARKFLDACTSLGVPREALFRAEDLTAARALPRVLQTVYALSALAQRDHHALPAYLAPLTPEQALELAAAGRAPGNPAVATVSVPVPVPEAASAQMHDEGVPAAAAVASAAAPVQEPAATAKPGKGTAPRKAPKPSAGKPVAVSASAGAEAGEPQPATPTQVRASSVEAVQRYMADAVVPKVEHIEYLARGSAFKARVAQTETECV